jgi:hypothetical protein
VVVASQAVQHRGEGDVCIAKAAALEWLQVPSSPITQPINALLALQGRCPALSTRMSLRHQPVLIQLLSTPI